MASKENGAYKPPTPAHLSRDARRFCDKVLAYYKLRPDELRLLRDACHEMSIIDSLQDYINTSPEYQPMVLGSQRQMIANPILGEIRQHRLAYASLVKQMHLPDVPSAIATDVEETSQGRAAAVENRFANREVGS